MSPKSKYRAQTEYNFQLRNEFTLCCRRTWTQSEAAGAWPLSGATVTACRRGTVALTFGDLEFGVAVRELSRPDVCLIVCLFACSGVDVKREQRRRECESAVELLAEKV